MIDWTKPIETTDGRKAHYIGEMPKECGWRCRRVVMMCNPCHLDYYNDDGKNVGRGIRNVEPTVEEWQNQYADFVDYWHATREQANKAKYKHIGCIGQIKRVRRGNQILDVKFVPLDGQEGGSNSH